MRKIPRRLYVKDNSTFHVSWKCHNNDFWLKDRHNKALYLRLLQRFKDKYRIQIHAYCIMDNHAHIVGFTPTQKELSDFFRIVNSLFARLVNQKHGRAGQLVMDRFHCSIIETQETLLRVINYVHLNPSKTRRRVHPERFQCSSYHHYAGSRVDPLIVEPEFFISSGHNHDARTNSYRRMIDEIYYEGLSSLDCPWRDQKGHFVPFMDNPKATQELRTILKLHRQQKQWINQLIQKAISHESSTKPSQPPTHSSLFAI